ncbi:sugar-binding domain-containing protein [uncultured Mediterranea sp.]|uniref:glycoside hydrolase family 2 protein n=1 Tax=uncultured Mediterranea sp. TaxID=1926662 RepID=UPI002804772E|nr:sugar-binding domain-containing protein [uncultured Mediterranea sp.]
MKIHHLLLQLLCVTFCISVHAQVMDLSGTWRFAVDRNDQGISDRWYLRSLDDHVQLPGSMITNGKGDPVDLNTPWVGSFNDQTFFKLDRYAPYRTRENFKIPYWLQPDNYYSGVAWYQRDIEIPKSWKKKSIHLFFERCHWESRVWIDGKEVGMQNALSAPQQYDLTDYLTPGKHTLSVRVDNAVHYIDPGENSHSISDHTQGNWNGIVGAMYLEAKGSSYYKQLHVFPQIEKGSLTVKANVCNTTDKRRKVTQTFSLQGKETKQSFTLQPGENQLEVTLALPKDVKTWNEFNPNLYTLSCSLQSGKEELDNRKVTFGCRTWSVNNGRLYLNDTPVFLRGTLHCASFPLTGYPATDKEEWMRELRICKQYGINHIRFHSWCPPEAAFQAADELGMYYMIECSSWANQSTTIGDGKPIDEFIRQEAERIVNAYGNHPSFCLMAYGNEPAGKHSNDYLTRFVSEWKERDPRRLYTSAAGWPNLPVNDFLSDANPRIQQWGAGIKSIINAQAPSTTYDWREYTGKFTQPFVSHEIGQWCVYPNFREMQKYTGVYKARNFEIFQESLKENGLIQLADSFLYASGKLQTLCYKADIEAALRTPNFGGFQLLGLNDFPGQGTALVGTLDVFWEEKGYVTAKEYSRFCNSLVPLARIPKLVLENNETFTATVEAANFYRPLTQPKAAWTIRDASGRKLGQGSFDVARLDIGNCLPLGNISFNLSDIHKASQLKLEVTVDGHSNDWDFWVYPSQKQVWDETLLLTDTLDQTALDRLQAGGKVLLSLKKGSLSKTMGGEVAVGFSSIFWNTAWTNGQAPHTLGILCDPAHPALRYFPTDYYSNYQWWDAMSHSDAIHLSKLSKDIRPLVRVIDDWVTNRSLGLLFEVKVGNGKLLVSGIDFHQDMERRPAARQLLFSLKQYMLSDAFQPTVSLQPESILKLTQP